MEYDNPQFTAAVRKVIRNLFSPTEPPVDAHNAQQDADDERNETPIATVSELRTQVPIRVQTESNESKAERIWKRTKGALEVIGIIAVIVYTGLANKQWHETISARHQTQLAIEAANRAASAAEKANIESSEHFVKDERPYIGLNLNLEPPPGVQPLAYNKGSKIDVIQDPSDPTKVQVLWSIHFKNFGKSPALNVRIDRHIELGPNAFQRWRWGEVSGAGTIMVPTDDEFFTAVSDKTPKVDVEKIMRSDLQIVVFGHIEYEGLESGSYWTEFCLSRLATDANALCPTHNLMK